MKSFRLTKNIALTTRGGLGKITLQHHAEPGFDKAVRVSKGMSHILDLSLDMIGFFTSRGLVTKEMLESIDGYILSLSRRCTLSLSLSISEKLDSIKKNNNIELIKFLNRFIDKIIQEINTNSMYSD